MGTCAGKQVKVGMLMDCLILRKVHSPRFKRDELMILGVCVRPHWSSMYCLSERMQSGASERGSLLVTQ